MIEQCFGQIKHRFPILQYGVRLQMDLIPKCIISCFILHSMSKMLNDMDDFDDKHQDQIILEELNEADADLRHQGQMRRQEIAQLIYNHN